MSATPTSIVPPIITLGPPGYLAAEVSVEAAVNHLMSEHPERDGVDRSEVLTTLVHYDCTGRKLRLEIDEGAFTLVPEDREIRRGALCALIDAAFAHARARAYEDPSPLSDLGIDHPSEVRPPQLPDAEQREPTDDAFNSFFRELVDRIQLQRGPEDRRGSWWHNLFYH